MKPSWKEFLVGVTVLIGLIGVSVLLLLFGEFSTVRQRAYEVKLVVGDASGLSKASAVTLNGVNAGAIHEITMADPRDPRLGVTISLRVNEGIRIPKDVEVTLERGLVGEASLAMRSAPLEQGMADPGYLAEGETLRTEARGFFDAITSVIDQRIGAFTDAAKAIEELSRTYTDVGKKIGSLVEPRSPDAVDGGQGGANLSSTLARLDRAVKSAERWLGDDVFRDDATQAASRLTDLMDKIAAAVEQVSKTAAAIGTDAEELNDNAASALREFSRTMGSLNETVLEVQTLVAKVNRGEGTAGQLVNNPDLYNSVNDAAMRLEKALVEAQLLFEKYRKEGIPIDF